MEILVIDNNIDPDSWGASELCALARVPGATIRVRRAPHDDLPRDTRRFDRIVISGSKTPALEEAPWISRLDELIREVVSEGKPLFGVCYGHQAIARALGGIRAVRRADQGEFGWGRIHLTEEGKASPLMRDLPESFHSFQWHHDEVCELSPGMRILARSEVCAIQAFQIEGRPVYGVQFHPERALEAGERSLAKRFKENPEIPVLNRGLGPKLYKAEIGTLLFRNFIALGSSPEAR